MRGRCERRDREMARKRRRSVGDTIVLLVILAALVWAFVPGVGWDLLGLRSRLGWPPLRSGQALASLPDSEAARQLRELTVRESVDDPDAPAYKREVFGQRWEDTDRNGCDTRNDILARDLARPTFKPDTRDCVVLSGTLAEPYTGATIEFQRGDKTSSLVQIDHVVALADAWRSGAWQWDAQRRQEFANDPENLLAVDGAANEDKSASSADQWLPPNTAFRCDYVKRQIAVKNAYGLSVTRAEQDALAEQLSACTG